MNREGTTMGPLKNYGPVVLAAVENCVLIDVTVIVRAGVHDATAVQTHVVDARAVVDSPTSVDDAAFVSVHFVVVVVIVGVAVTKTWVGYYSCWR